MKRLTMVVVIAAPTILFFIFVLLAWLLHYIRKSRKSCPSDDVEAHDGNDVQHKDTNPSVQYPTDQNHSSITESRLPKLDVGSQDSPLTGELHLFDDDEDSYSFTTDELSMASVQVLGSGFHGTTYQATFQNTEYNLVTVKWLRSSILKPKGEFMENASRFANIRHPNIVAVRGYLWGPTHYEKFILSDCISSSKTLDSHLYGKTGTEEDPSPLPLTSSQRLKIALDMARALTYLHLNEALPHGNLKPTNILITHSTSNITAKLSDYSLHTLLNQTAIHDQIIDSGLLGYRAPELSSSNRPQSLHSFKSDIYTFGVILLEILTGKCAGQIVSWTKQGGGIELVDWVEFKEDQGRLKDCFDLVLMEEMMRSTRVRNIMEVMLQIALKCVRSESERPGIKTVCQSLESLWFITVDILEDSFL